MASFLKKMESFLETYEKLNVVANEEAFLKEFMVGGGGRRALAVAESTPQLDRAAPERPLGGSRESTARVQTGARPVWSGGRVGWL